MIFKSHAVYDSQGHHISFFDTVGQVSVSIGSWALLSSLPNVDSPLKDLACDADWFRKALKDHGIRAGITGQKQREKTLTYDKRRYKRRKRIETVFGRLKRLEPRGDPLRKMTGVLLLSNRIRRDRHLFGHGI